ncbi:ATP-binding protein [bacterium]|nr:ATP-binding protein [bacterium]
MIEEFNFSDDIFTKIIQLLYIQLILDIQYDRAKNDHIAPVIHRLKTSQADLNKITKCEDLIDLWDNYNFVVIDLKNVNLKMKKIVPLVLSKYVYDEHKTYENGNRYLNIIIDEAHNILSSDSYREAESWKDYRLETFEEIIKEGRKFGTYLTIASQRPSDISSTIISQAHNYFIHRLVNQEDLRAIGTSVSYIDKLTLDSIPTLPVGYCIFNGISTQMPLLLHIDKLSDEQAPNSDTVCISKMISI